jgi:hypothetical protein
MTITADAGELPAVELHQDGLPLDLSSIDWDAAKDRMIDTWYKRSGVLYAAQGLVSPIPEGTDIANAVKGSRMLGLELTPQGCEVAGVLEAKNTFGLPLYDDVTVQIPRRATKTTSIQTVLLGRCENRPGYRIIQTAQDGTRASMVFMDMVRTMERVTPDPEDRNWKVFKSTGREYLEWDNGSRWWVGPPKSSTYRGLAADVLWFDESGELSPEESDDLEAGALPVMDTRPDGQVIKSGTPGLVRAGLFWKSLAVAEENPAQAGVVNYAARESDVVDLDEDRAMALLWRHHPGMACGLTTEAKMRKRFQVMDLAQFIREYLCVWPPDTTITALDMAKFAAGECNPVGLPSNVPYAFGFNVAQGGVAAAVAVAWYDGEDLHAQIMEYRLKADWVPDDLARALKAHVGTDIGYDSIGDNVATAQAVARKPRVNTKTLRALTMKEVAAGTAAIAQAVDGQRFYWGTSPALLAAAKGASWRDSGGSRLFRRIQGQDISALLAVTHAVAAVATKKKKRSGGAGYAPQG